MRLISLVLFAACTAPPALQADGLARLYAGPYPTISLQAPVVAAGDLDGGGVDDLVSVHGEINVWRVDVRPGGPSGPSTQPAWSAVVPRHASGGYPSPTLCDVDGDGDDELFLVQATVSDIPWWSGGPQGPAQRAPLSVPPGLNAEGEAQPTTMGGPATCADLDGDGISDLLAPVISRCDQGRCQSGLALWTGSATGVLSAPQFLPSPSKAPGDWLSRAIVLGDVDGDGRTEVAQWRWSQVDVWSFGGPGDVRSDSWSAPSSGPVELGDLNGDGLTDLAMTCTVVAYATEPRLTSGVAAIIDPCAGPALPVGPLAVGDLDGDGLDELGSIDRNTLRAYRGTAAAPGWSPRGLDLSARLGRPPLAYIEGIQPVGDLWGVGHDVLILANDTYTAGSPSRFVVSLPDLDGDGVAAGMDCDDRQPAVGAGALAWQDADADSDGSPWRARRVCGRLPAGWVRTADDCDDQAQPGVDAPNDGIDSDCDGRDLCAIDADGDGFAGAVVALSPLEACLVGGAADCDDADPLRQPGAELPGDDIDAGCDGVGVCFADDDGDRLRSDTTVAAAEPCVGPALPATAPTDCDDLDAARGRAEVANNDVDEDCDGRLVCAQDADDDGMWVASDPADVATCAGFDPTVVLAAGEDCDDHRAGLGRPQLWFQDVDGDGYGTYEQDERGHIVSPATIRACGHPRGYASSSGDCDALDPAVHPGAAELIDGVRDEDCDRVWVTPWDGDGDGRGGRLVINSTLPTWLVAEDCDDADPLTLPLPAFAVPGAVDCAGVVEPALDVTGGVATVTGMAPAAAVTLYASTVGSGLGTCPPGLGGGCLPIVAPVVIAQGQADALGTWSAPVALAGQWLVAVADAPRVAVTDTAYVP